MELQCIPVSLYICSCVCARARACALARVRDKRVGGVSKRLFRAASRFVARSVSLKLGQLLHAL